MARGFDHKNPTADAVRAEIIAQGHEISESGLAILTDMYSAPALMGTESDEPVVIRRDVRIQVVQGAAMNRAIKENGVRRSLEIGFAYGFSTAWIMEALSGVTDAQHVAIDPHERTVWGGVGLAQVERFDAMDRLRWMPSYSIIALTDLLREREKFDFVYIDGNHRFDDVLVDFYLADQLVSPGGLVAFDDMWMPSVQTVVGFVATNRAYEAVPQPADNLALMRKLRDDDRDWRHFEPFPVARPRFASRLARRARRLAAGST